MAASRKPSEDAETWQPFPKLLLSWRGFSKDPPPIPWTLSARHERLWCPGGRLTCSASSITPGARTPRGRPPPPDLAGEEPQPTF